MKFNERTSATLSYLLFWFSGLFFLITEKENKYVRFHALQSTILFGGLSILGYIVVILPLIGGLIKSILGLITLVAWAYLMFQAYTGKSFKVPVIGDIVFNQIYKK